MHACIICLLPKRPPSRQTEADSWTILSLGFSPRLHSALNLAQYVYTHTHTYTHRQPHTATRRQKLSSVFSVCSAWHTWASGSYSIVELFSERCQQRQILVDPGFTASRPSVALRCLQSENKRKNCQGAWKQNKTDGQTDRVQAVQ